MVSFYYQDLDVYYIAMGFVETVVHLAREFKPSPPPRIGKLEELSTRIPLTMARASGRYGTKMPPQVLLDIRGQIFEVQALLEVLWRSKELKDSDIDELSDTLMVMAKMVTDMAGQSDRKEPGWTDFNLKRYI